MKQYISKPMCVTHFSESQDSDSMQDHETALSRVSMALQGFGETKFGEQEPHKVFWQADRRKNRMTVLPASRCLGRGWCYSRDNQPSPGKQVSRIRSCVHD